MPDTSIFAKSRSKLINLFLLPSIVHPVNIVSIIEPFIKVQPDNSDPFNVFADFSDFLIRAGTYEIGSSAYFIIEREAARFSICPSGLV